MLGALRFSTLSGITWPFDGDVIHDHVDEPVSEELRKQFSGTNPGKIYFGAVGVEKTGLIGSCALCKIYIQACLHLSFQLTVLLLLTH